VDGKTLTQPLLLKMDPRLKTPPEGLRAQLDRSRDVAADMARTMDALHALRADQAKFKEGPRSKTLADRADKLTDLNAKLVSLYTSMQEVDAPPTAAMVDAAAELRRRVTEALTAPAKTPPR
jgi:hypothetical protein